MKRRVRLPASLCLLSVCCLAALLVVVAPAKAEDTTPPQITAFSVTPSEVNTESADQTLSVTMTLTDDQAGLSWSPGAPGNLACCSITLLPLIGTQNAWCGLLDRISGDELNGVYSGTIVLPKGSKEGVWRVARLELWDKIGNEAVLDWQSLEAKFGAGCASVTNTATDSDVTPPQITAFSVTPSEVNTESADQTLSVTMTLTDDQAGLSWSPGAPGNLACCSITLLPLIGTQNAWCGLLDRISGDELNGVYSGTIVLPKGSKEGVWRVARLELWDKIGNEAVLDWQSLEAKFGAGCASVTNTATDSDVTPPQITAFSVTPSEVNTESADQTLSVTMTLTDDQAGLSWSPGAPGNLACCSITLLPLIGTQNAWCGLLDRISGDELNGVYSGTIVLPKGSKEGVWRVARLELWDKIGNEAVLDSDSLGSLLPTAEGLAIANTARAQQVTIDREWTISTAHTSVTFPAGTVVTRQDNGRFAFYRMTSGEFTLDDGIPTTGLDGVPIATLRFGIPGLNLAFDRPVEVSMVVGSAYDGYRLNVQSLTEGGAAWANETTCDVVDGRCSFTVNHATRFVANVAAPTVRGFTPASGPVGTVVTLTGTHFTGATKVRFHGRSATSFTLVSAGKIRATVPAGASTGAIAVTTPGGTATSTQSFTVLVKPTLTLRLSGLASGAIKLGKGVTAKGTVKPASLAGSQVKLTVQKQKGGAWVKVKSVARTISATGAYSWTYKLTSRGAYRMQAMVAKTATHTAAMTKWSTFKVK